MTSSNGIEAASPASLKGRREAIFVCWVLGIGTLIAWNSMLTIGDYYYSLFPESYHPARVLTLVYQPFALGTIGILAYYESQINTRKRNLAGYFMFTISTLMLLVMAIVTPRKPGVGAFIGICAVVAVFGLADAHVQGGMVGDLSLMSPQFIQSYFGGLAAAGAITSGLRLITKAVFDKAPDGLRKGVMLFLGISTFMELLCLVMYAFYFPKLPIVRYYRAKAASEGSTTVSSDLAAAGVRSAEVDDDPKHHERLSTKELFFQNIDFALDIFLVFLLTLSIFPGFLYENTGEHGLGEWYAVVLVAMYNAGDLIGRYIPLIKFLTLESRKGLAIAVLVRFLLVPAFYFTAKYSDQGWMIMLTGYLGLSNGYLAVCIMTAAPKGYKGPEQNALGNLLVVFLLGGIFAGVALDWLWLIGKGSF